MVKVDLITGFLGAGKTTFIRKYAQFLIDSGYHIGILENDFGAVNVDMMLLQDLMGEQCELEMISGGCDKDCHRRRFKTKLIAMGMCGYDRVIIEPSGIYDVDEFFDVLREEPLDQWYEIGNVITIVDAKLENELSQASDYVLASECANAGKVLLSRTKEASDTEKEATIAHLNRALEQVHCKRRLTGEIVQKDWDTFTKEDFEAILHCGYVPESYRKLDFEEEEAFTSVYFMNVQMDEAKLCDTVEKILQDETCGTVFRIKGFLKKEDGSFLELNATKKGIRIQPIAQGQEVFIVIGEGLNKERIQSYWE